jgi:hypothetical protein
MPIEADSSLGCYATGHSGSRQQAGSLGFPKENGITLSSSNVQSWSTKPRREQLESGVPGEIWQGVPFTFKLTMTNLKRSAQPVCEHRVVRQSRLPPKDVLANLDPKTAENSACCESRGSHTRAMFQRMLLNSDPQSGEGRRATSATAMCRATGNLPYQ